MLLMPTLSFEGVDVYHQVDVISKHSCRSLMDITLAGPKTFNAVAMLIFFKWDCYNIEGIEENNIVYILF